MKANNTNIKVGNVLIFLVDEWNTGSSTEMDGHVQIIDDLGVHVIYLSGYRSRNDFIPWNDIIAKVDKRRKWVSLGEFAYKGNFLVFDREEKQIDDIAFEVLTYDLEEAKLEFSDLVEQRSIIEKKYEASKIRYNKLRSDFTFFKSLRK